VRLEGLSQLKNPLTSWGIETAIFREKKIKRTGIKNEGKRDVTKEEISKKEISEKYN
jgi:hypothetical protein